MAEFVCAPTTPPRPRRDPRTLADQIERYGCDLNVLHIDMGHDLREAALLIREQLILIEQLQVAPVTHAMVRAASESRACDEEGEFESLGDLIDFSGENKTHTVIRAALEAALRERPSVHG